jgi:hypothetical protein
VAHFVWQNRPTHGPPHTNWGPWHPARDRRTLARQWGVRRGSESICEGEGREPPKRGNPSHEPAHSPSGFFLLPCQAGCLTATVGTLVPRGPLPQERGRPPTAAWGDELYTSPAPCCGDRSPGAFWSPALVESVDRWPLASPDTKIPGGSRPVVAVVRRRCPRGPVPPPEGRMPQATSARKGVFWGHCVRTGT